MKLLHLKQFMDGESISFKMFKTKIVFLDVVTCSKVRTDDGKPVQNLFKLVEMLKSYRKILPYLKQLLVFLFQL